MLRKAVYVSLQTRDFAFMGLCLVQAVIFGLGLRQIQRLKVVAVLQKPFSRAEAMRQIMSSHHTHLLP